MLCTTTTRYICAQLADALSSLAEVRLHGASRHAAKSQKSLRASLIPINRQRIRQRHGLATSLTTRQRQSRNITTSTQTSIGNSPPDNAINISPSIPAQTAASDSPSSPPTSPDHRRTSPTSSTYPFTYNTPRPSPKSPQPHHDLPTFLAHARRTRLSPNRTVYKGTFFEYAVAAALKRLGFKLIRSGGASDRGVDLVGWWRIPRSRIKAKAENESGRRRAEGTDEAARETVSAPTARPIRVIIQCRAVRKGPRPSDVRELESTVSSAAGFAFTGMELDDGLEAETEAGTASALSPAPSSAPAEDVSDNGNQEDNRIKSDHGSHDLAQDEGILGLLVSTGDATRGVREALGRSRWPVGFLKVSTSFGNRESMMSTNVNESDDERDNSDVKVNVDPAINTDDTNVRATIEQFIWNYVATDRWLTGLGVAVSYFDDSSSSASSSSSQTSSRRDPNSSSPGGDADGRDDGIVAEEKTSALRKEISLTWKGEPLPSAPTSNM